MSSLEFVFHFAFLFCFIYLPIIFCFKMWWPSVCKQTTGALVLLSCLRSVAGAHECSSRMSSTITSRSSIEVSSVTSTDAGTRSATHSETNITSSTSSEPSNSPPQTTDAALFLVGPDWTSAYTYFEAAMLPTFTSTEVEMPTPTVGSFCMLGPLELQGQRLQPALFKFEQPKGAPEGLYDLVIEDDTGRHYVSWGVDGAVSFMDQSSLSTTTIFSVNCRGYLTIRSAGASYTWRVTHTGFTAVTPGETEDGIAVLRPSLSKPIEATGSGEPELARMRRLIRPVFAQPRPGRQPENPNGCGSNNGMGGFMPDFNWGHCCDLHDNCYHDCSESFQICNNDFLGCMYNQCRADVTWWNWWSTVPRLHRYC
ncbi:hypothetical protein N657DRAFT_696066 [Parathielavia appendiculata]|uniref:Uncharacterized protein n=1 Tax=Parathielavia appendiculata TaxID=2587402 RepID=A0AAN6U921_9PEZI|nr:hypothetical protein N657DRAFT_696066 [Parathielavia appendiculata]